MKNYNFKINGNEYAVTVEGISDGKAKVSVNGVGYEVDCPATTTTPRPQRPRFRAASGTSTESDKLSAGQPSPKQTTGGKIVEAPLPGVIINLSVTPGQTVRRGQKIAVLEAMKMENDILSPADGTIDELFVQRGDSVLEGAKIATIS